MDAALHTQAAPCVVVSNLTQTRYGKKKVALAVHLLELEDDDDDG